MKKFFFIFCLYLLFFSKSVFAQDKIVFIDMNFILNNSLAGKDLKMQLEEKNSNIKNKLKNYQDDINQKKEKILGQKNVLSTEDYENKLKEIQSEVIKINKLMSQEDKNYLNFKKKNRKRVF